MSIILRKREDSSSRFDAYILLTKLLSPDCIPIRYADVQPIQPTFRGVWFRVVFSSGETGLIGMPSRVTDSPAGSPYMSRVREFLSFLQEKVRLEFSIVDFGEWAPPKSSAIYRVCPKTFSFGNLFSSFYLCCNSRPEDCTQDDLRDFGKKFHSRCRVRLKVSLPFDWKEGKRGFEVSGSCRIRGPGIGGVRSGKLRLQEGRIMAQLEGGDEMPLVNRRLPAQLMLPEFEMAFEDFLRLEPGDELDFGLEEELRATVVVGGVSIAQGKLLIKPGKFVFLVGEDGDFGGKGGNISRESSIEGGEGIQEQGEYDDR